MKRRSVAFPPPSGVHRPTRPTQIAHPFASYMGPAVFFFVFVCFCFFFDVIVAVVVVVGEERIGKVL